MVKELFAWTEFTFENPAERVLVIAFDQKLTQIACQLCDIVASEQWTFLDIDLTPKAGQIISRVLPLV